MVTCSRFACTNPATHLATKDVVHDARAVVKVLETRQQRLDARLAVRRVQLAHLLIWQGRQRAATAAGNNVVSMLSSHWLST
jgi:hypothetical protein